MQTQLHPSLPHLLIPDAAVDFIGVFVTVIIPLFMGVLVTSDKARQATQAILSLYTAYRNFRERNRPKPAPAVVTNGNGQSNGNGNGNGSQSELLKSVMQTIRSESDARESGDDVVKADLRETKERMRRDVDNLYMAFSDLNRDTRRHGESIRLLEVETTALRAQMAGLFRNDEEMNTKLDAILHLLQPDAPTPPGKAIIPLDDNEGLEATG